MGPLKQENSPPDPAKPRVVGRLVHHREELPALIPDREPHRLEEVQPALPVRDGLLDPRVPEPDPPELVVPGLLEQVPEQLLRHLHGGRGRVAREVRGRARAGAASRREAAVEVLGDGVLGGEGVAAVGARDGVAAVRIWAAGGGGGDERGEGGEIGGAGWARGLLLLGGRSAGIGVRVGGAGGGGGGGGGGGAEDVGGALEGWGGGGGDLLHEILHLVLHHGGRRRRVVGGGGGGGGGDWLVDVE